MAKHSPKFESAKYVSSAEEQVMDDSYADTIIDEHAVGKPESGQLSEEKQNFFNPYIPEIMDVFSDQDMGGYEKMHYMEGFRDFVARGNDQYWVRADIEQGIDLVDPDDFHKSSVFLDVIRHSFRADAEHTERTKTILRKYVESVDKHKCNYLLLKKLNLVIESDHKNDLNINYINSPVPTGMQRYVMYDAWGVAHISDPNDYDLLQKLVPKTAQRTMKNPDYRNRFLETDWKPKTENFTEDDYEEIDRLWESHEDFLWQRGSDFEEVAKKRYGFHKISSTDIGLPEETRGEIVDFSYFLSPEMVVLLHDEFGVDVRSIPLKERFYFLNYLKNTTVAEAETMQEFTKTHGVEGMRTFLALEQEGEEFGDEIVAFGQNVEVAKEVFKSYSDLLDAANDAEDVVRETVDCEQQDCDTAVERVRSTVLGRAQDLLVRAVRTGSAEKLEEQLAGFSKEGTLFASVSRALFEQGNFSFEQMKDASFEVADGQELGEDDIEEMERLYRANYRDEKYEGSFIETLVGKMKEGLKDPFTRWYVLRHKEIPIGFCKFTDHFDDETGALSERHFGAFNVNRRFGNGKLGEAMFVEVIKEESKEGVPIVAECLPEAAITSKYIETGFNAIRSSEFADERILHIVRTNETAAHPAKALDIDTLFNEGWHGHELRKLETDDEFPELDEQMELVRYFSRGGERYGLFTPKKL